MSIETVVKEKNAKKINFPTSYLFILVTLRSILSQCFYILHSISLRSKRFRASSSSSSEREQTKNFVAPAQTFAQ